jgi:hypothetical protein
MWFLHTRKSRYPHSSNLFSRLADGRSRAGGDLILRVCNPLPVNSPNHLSDHSHTTHLVKLPVTETERLARSTFDRA